MIITITTGIHGPIFLNNVAKKMVNAVMLRYTSKVMTSILTKYVASICPPKLVEPTIVPLISKPPKIEPNPTHNPT